LPNIAEYDMIEIVREGINMTERKKIAKTYRLPQELIEFIQQTAQEKRWNDVTVIEVALEEMRERLKKSSV